MKDVIIGEYVEFKYCDCGCKLTHPKYQTQRGKPRKDRPNKYKSGHQNRPQEIKDKISEANSGEKNGMYLGDKVGYNGLHAWIRKYLPPQKLCQICFIKPPFDVACITFVYNRNFKNWLRLCRSCHEIYDKANN